MYTQEGRLLFKSPPKDAIDKWKKVDSRITYFRFRLPSSDQDKDSEQEPEIAVHVSEKDQVTYPASEESLRFYKIMNPLGIPDNLFNLDAVVRPLEQYLAEKYAGRKIALRGTACNVRTRPVVIDGKNILNPFQIIQRGVETQENHAPMTPFDSGRAEIYHRSAQWLVDHPREFREKAKEEGEDLGESIFPILLVYDRSKFPENSTRLPDDPEKRSQCILEAIILDYPLSNSEYQQQERG